MSIFEVTSRISRQWLERKTKSELASIIMANIDRIDLFAEEYESELAETRKALLQMQKERDEAVPWKEAIIDASINNFLGWSVPPHEVLANLIRYEVQLALDPRVSSSAANLIKQGGDKWKALADQLAHGGSLAMKGMGKHWVSMEPLRHALAAYEAATKGEQ